jgi:hypothetical protein
LRTKPCGSVISSGITCPFGQLSRSPGYISDSLLTRSPLTLAGPCDLHVLATPPAFRLSQDQTLQLFFVARVTPDAPRQTPDLHPKLLAASDTFATRVYPRRRICPNRSATPDIHSGLRPAVTAYRPAKVDRSVDLRPTRRASPPAKRASIARLKHLLAATPAQLSSGRGGYSNKMIKRSLTCVLHHEDVRDRPIRSRTRGKIELHVLAAKIRLFTFQRAHEEQTYSAMRNPSRLFVKRLHPLTAVAFVLSQPLNRRWSLAVSRKGSRILSRSSGLSTGVEKNSLTVVSRPFIAGTGLSAGQLLVHEPLVSRPLNRVRAVT